MEILGIGSRINHPEHGKGVVTNIDSKHYWVTFIENGLETIALNDDFEVIEAAENEVDTISLFDVESSLVRILKKYSDVSEIVPIGDKWKGGVLELKPADSNLKSKVIKIEDFFHKITMVRDRLRVMEQKVNSSNLEPSEKVDIQQYITRIYGSLTTFNVLFKSKEQQFVGQKSK
ncbi:MULTISPECIES: hypothetical protein [unclassified Olleya]|uniref:hypothetical protein n=1 Tax=unclassified Olleya TaxID=2615019 RepID=UPI00119E834E|nr:hypothetical protein [Olleya sp. Hel_I_94]TVZ46131.1 hypothetical protein JM82_0699 [Olleya sp. Hel_I_94]|tara:strand:+ start:56112 stop:56636 length:525 start_codon:yes stop_codon:yes gene_type:complete